MLRITVQDEAVKIVLKLDGKISGPWVNELESCWESIRQMRPGKQMVVDLTEVGFVNAPGSELLERMHLEGAEFLGDGPLTRSILDDIARRATAAHGKVG